MDHVAFAAGMAVMKWVRLDHITFSLGEGAKKENPVSKVGCVWKRTREELVQRACWRRCSAWRQRSRGTLEKLVHCPTMTRQGRALWALGSLAGSRGSGFGRVGQRGAVWWRLGILAFAVQSGGEPEGLCFDNAVVSFISFLWRSNPQTHDC